MGPPAVTFCNLLLQSRVLGGSFGASFGAGDFRRRVTRLLRCRLALRLLASQFLLQPPVLFFQVVPSGYGGGSLSLAAGQCVDYRLLICAGLGRRRRFLGSGGGNGLALLHSAGDEKLNVLQVLRLLPRMAGSGELLNARFHI